MYLSLVIYIYGRHTKRASLERYTEKKMVMDHLLPTYMVQGERNWYAL